MLKALNIPYQQSCRTIILPFLVTENVGIKWSELREVLNPNFNWEAAVKKTTGLESFVEVGQKMYGFW